MFNSGNKAGDLRLTAGLLSFSPFLGSWWEWFTDIRDSRRWFVSQGEEPDNNRDDNENYGKA